MSLLYQALNMEHSFLPVPSVSTQAIITKESDVTIQKFSLLSFKVWSWVLGPSSSSKCAPVHGCLPTRECFVLVFWI